MKSISIIIPCYNEENRIKKTLQKLQEYLLKSALNYEIIIIDDGSKDNTFEIVKLLSFKNQNIKIIRNKVNRGKGYSVKKGVFSAGNKYEYIYFTDADLSTPIEELEKFIYTIQQGNFDIVIGSRALADSKIIVHQPFYREIMGKIFNKFVKLLCIKDFSDTQCGSKLFKTEVAKKIFSISKIHRFAFDVEILYIAKSHNYKIKEIPVKWINSFGSKVHPFFDSFRMLMDLFKIKFLH